MIKLFNRIDELNSFFALQKKNDNVKDYRIYLNLNNSIKIYVIQGQYSENEISQEIHLREDEDLEMIGVERVKEDEYIREEVFSDTNPYINISDTRRRLTNLLGTSKTINKEIPVLTFYSYKGGVGRSTALASCASYISYHFGKRVVILDCDFEAPGFTNFYLEAPDTPINKEGLIEYFIDSYTSETGNLNEYYWQVSKIFSGEGEIYVFPAGNLDDEDHIDGFFNSHRIHYLNGLSRIDMFSPDVLTKQFEDLFEKIKNEIHPDAIFIDSRTGFNDIFGVSAFRLSDAVIGFFGNNTQTRPGLNFFLEILTQKTAPRLMVVNSIIPSTHMYDRVERFKQYIEQYLDKLSSEIDDNRDIHFDVETFYVSSNDVLNNLGTRQEDYRDFIRIITTKSFPDYNTLFERIRDIIEETSYSVQNTKLKENAASIKDDDIPSVNEECSEVFCLKKTILRNLQNNMPQLYANVTDFSEEYNRKRYFYRSCMEDLFNPNKILIIGNKGTGKTYIYRSLRESNIVEELKRRANKTENYFFVQAVSQERRFDTLKLDNLSLNTLEYERFWMVYIWDTIMLDKPFGYESKLQPFMISDDTATKDAFLKYIKNEDQFKLVEQDMKQLDDYLYEKKTSRIIVVFDELDNVVNPVKWSERVAPLINLCKKMSYRNISPKLFVRSDLYDKTGNINNKNELRNRSIDIEWNREELFAFFFTHLFSHSRLEFFDFMKKSESFSSHYINKVARNLEKIDNQVPADSYLLKHLCNVFFGEYADPNNNPRFGESYDWFFKNLQNANGTLSLRPFIDLVSISVEQALAEDTKETPILSPFYYTMGKNRAKAVEHHFDDLAAESGNEDLKPIIEYIRDRASYKFKKDKLFQQDFFNLLDNIINNCNLVNCNDRDEIIRFLEINGIISQSHVRYTGQVHKQYTFALLYKYYLGLKSNRRYK